MIISPQNLGCWRMCSFSFRGQGQGSWRGWSLECKGSFQNLGQRADWELYTQPGPFGTPLWCPALQRAHHRFSKCMDECMNDLAGNKMLLPFCHLPTHLWPIALPIRGGDLLVCVLAGSGLWLNYVRWVPICCESRNQSFSLPQNVGSSPGDSSLSPGLKFPSLLSLRG